MEITSKRYQQIQSEERATISSLKQQNYSLPAIARVLQRPANIISREQGRNSASDHLGGDNQDLGRNCMPIPCFLVSAN